MTTLQARLMVGAGLVVWGALNFVMIHDPLQSVLYVVGFFKGVL
jgi:hypothetical protein